MRPPAAPGWLRGAPAALLLLALGLTPRVALADDGDPPPRKDPPTEEPQPRPEPEDPPRQDPSGDDPPTPQAGDEPADPDVPPELTEEERAAQIAAVSAEVQVAVTAAAPLMRQGSVAFADENWDAAIDLFTLAGEALATQPVLGGLLDQNLYNLCCAHARRAGEGDVEAAADLFARSVEHGLRAVLSPAGPGRWRVQPGLSLEHVLADTDLEPIREHPTYLAAMAGFLAQGDLEIHVVGGTGEEDATAEGQEGEGPEKEESGAEGADQRQVPVVLVLCSTRFTTEAGLAAFLAASAPRPYLLAGVAGPIRRRADWPEWTLLDGDERWGIARVERALETLRADPRVDPERIYLVAGGPRCGGIAWSVAAAHPDQVAGLAPIGARFHGHWLADSLAAVPAARGEAGAWRMVLGPTDTAAAGAAEGLGAEPVLLPEETEPADAVRLTLAALLGE